MARRAAILFIMTVGHATQMWRLAAMAVAVTLTVAPSARATDRPHYDVPRGYIRCAHVQAWNGFFKWASVQRTTCRYASSFMRAYAVKAAHGDMPRRLHAYRCKIRYWRNQDGDIYASRHACRRGSVAIRFYGMM
jgi:hypothetical protein